MGRNVMPILRFSKPTLSAMLLDLSLIWFNVLGTPITMDLIQSLVNFITGLDLIFQAVYGFIISATLGCIVFVPNNQFLLHSNVYDGFSYITKRNHRTEAVPSKYYVVVWFHHLEYLILVVISSRKNICLQHGRIKY